MAKAVSLPSTPSYLLKIHLTQLLATRDPVSCQKLQIKHLLWEFAISCSFCYGHMWLHVPKHTRVRVIDLHSQEVPGLLCGVGDTLHPSFQPLPSKVGLRYGVETGLLGSCRPWLRCSFLYELLLHWSTSTLELESYVFHLKDTERFFREFRAPKTRIYKQAD